MLLRVPTRFAGLVARICFALFLFGAHVATGRAQGVPQQQAKFRYWTTSWSFEEIDLRDLTGKLKSIGVQLPIEMSGTASLNFDVFVPLNGLRDPKAYKFRGSLSSPRLVADEFVLEKFAANVSYSDGILQLTDLRGKQGNGSFEGSATAHVASQGPFDASLRIEQFDLGPTAELLAKLGIGNKDELATGRLDGEVKVSGTLDKASDIASWIVAGKLRLSDLKVGGSIPYAVTIDDLVLRDGRLLAPNLQVRSSALTDFSMTARADVQLTGTQKFDIALQGDDLPSTDLVGLYFDSPELLLDGKLDLKGNATGELNPDNGPSPNLNVQLAIASPSMRVVGVDLGLLEHQLTLTPDAISLQPLRTPSQRVTVETIRAEYRADPQRFKVTNLEAKLFGGTILGSAEVARAADGNHRVDAEWKDLNPKMRLPLGFGGEHLVFSAHTTGKVQWSASAEKVEYPAFHRANVAVSIDPLTLGTESLGSVDVDFRITDCGSDLHGQGPMFGGRVELTSTAALNPAVRWSGVPKLMTSGQLLLNKVSVSDVVKILAQRNLRRISGQISGTTEFTIDRSHSGLGTRSRWTVRDLRVDGRSISRRLDADVSTLGAEVQLRSVTGNYAGGQLQATGRWSLAGAARTIDARMIRVDGDRMLLPLHETAGRWVSGKVSGRASITGYGDPGLGDVRISGSARLNNGRTFDIPVGNAHTPFRVVVRSDPLSWQAHFSNVRSALAQGQVSGDLHFDSSGASRRGFNMESRWRLNHVEFEQLLHTYAGTNTLGRGDVTGRFVLVGKNIRSLNDLKGEFRMTLGGTDVAAVPGLQATSSLLGVAALTGTKFNSGETKGRIVRGGVVIEQLVLLSDPLKVISSGRVGLEGGRLDMMTIATTGSFTGQHQVLESIAPQALLSVSPVSSLNGLISDRTVVVDMVGTLRNPQIQLRSGDTLQANLRSFLIRQLTGQLAVESAILGNDW